MAAKGTGAGRKPGNGSGTTYAGGVVPSRGAALEFERSINKSGYIDDTPVPVVVIDCDHVIEFINASAALMAGCSPQSCVGLKMWDVFEMEGCRNGTCLASRAMRDGHTQSGDAECIIKGQKNTVRASASPRYDAHNKVIGAIEVLQHNSEDQKFADELSRLVNASHEGQLQVRGNTELLQGRNRDLMADCGRRYRTIVLPGQIGTDGSQPLELARTKPYGYCLFNLEALATLCQIVSESGDNLWEFETADGRGMRKAVAWMFPYIRDKKTWPKAPDVMYFEDWPMRQESLLFGGLAYGRAEYIDLWKKLPADSDVDEVIRNYFIRQPVLWV